MAELIKRVQPGDLIRAEYLNGIIELLETLEVRVAQLEASTPGSGTDVVIFEPNPSRTLHIGEQLKIIGKNFGLPSQNLVKLEEVFIDTFAAGSDDQLLIVDSIPNVQNIPVAGRLVTLLLTNSKGAAQTKFLLMPPEVTIPTGTLSLALTQTPAGPISSGGNGIFVYTVSAVTTLDDTYTIEPSITGAGWTAQYVDNSNNPVNPPQLFIAKPENPVQGTQVGVRVRVSAGATPAASADLSLKVTSQKNPGGLAKTSGVTPLALGAPPPPPEKLGITVESVVAPGAKSGDGISVSQGALTAQGANIGVTLKVTFLADASAGTFVVAPITFTSNPGSLWSAQIVGSATRAMSPPSSLFSVIVNGKTGAANTKMSITVTKQNDAATFGSQEIDITVT